MRLRLFGFLVVLSTVGFSQVDIDMNHTQFWDYETQQPIIILSDSVYLIGKDLSTRRIKPLDLDNSHLNRLVPTRINNKTYLFDSAGGIVVEYENQQFKRIDQSFSHKNQYGSAYFTYQNKVYLLGGYGLFAFKNILVAYDFDSNEWFLKKTSGDVPKYISTSIFTVVGDKLYFIDRGPMHTKDTHEDVVYALNLNTFEFEYLGKSLLNKKLDFRNRLYDGRVISFDDDTSFILDFENNTIKQVITPSRLHPDTKFLKYDSNEDTYTLLTKSFGNNEIRFEDVAAQNLDYKTISSEPLYQSDGKSLRQGIFYGGILVVFLGFSYFGYRWRTHYTKLQINISQQVVTTRGREVKSLNPEELNLLIYIAKQPNYVEYSELMHQLNYDAPYDTLKKKRQALISQTQEKLIPIIGEKAKQLFIIKQNLQDKRNKVIKLNKNLVVIVK